MEQDYPLEMIPEGWVKPIPTWIGIFRLVKSVDPRQVIGRYFISNFSHLEDMRQLGFLLKGVALGMEEDLFLTRAINHWEAHYSYTPYRGILRDLWELPLIDRTDLTAGKFLWFLHCFEHAFPDLFPGYGQYCQQRDGVEQWTRDRLAEGRELARSFFPQVGWS